MRAFWVVVTDILACLVLLGLGWVVFVEVDETEGGWMDGRSRAGVSERTMNTMEMRAALPGAYFDLD
jgi:hypothetical protein